jgi:hypothetical protein
LNITTAENQNLFPAIDSNNISGVIGSIGGPWRTFHDGLPHLVKGSPQKGSIAMAHLSHMWLLVGVLLNNGTACKGRKQAPQDKLYAHHVCQQLKMSLKVHT